MCKLFFKLLMTFPIPMYNMCVTLCLFSALSLRVSALQTSVIIICYDYKASFEPLALLVFNENYKRR